MRRVNSPVRVYGPDLHRVALVWLAASSLMAILLIPPVVSSLRFDGVSGLFVLPVLSPIGGWVAYFRRNLSSAFWWGVPSLVLGLVFLIGHAPGGPAP